MRKIIFALILTLALTPAVTALGQTGAEHPAAGPPPETSAAAPPSGQDQSILQPSPLDDAAKPDKMSAIGSGLPLSGFDVIWNMGVFLLVLLLLYLALKALGRVSRFKGMKDGRSGFTLRGIQALDNRKYLAAVELEGRMIVVGVSSDRITPVADWFLPDGDQDEGLNIIQPSSQDAGLDLRLPDEDDHISFDLGLTDLKSTASPTADIGHFKHGGTKDKK